MRVIVSLLIMVVLTFALGLLKAGQQLGVAEAKVTYRLVDESGVPFSNQVVHAWFSFLDSRKNSSQIMNTDSNGYVELKDRAQESCGIWVEIDGYYRGRSEMDLVRTADYRIVDGKWCPYGETKELVLKKMSRLGKLRVPERSFCRWQIPAFDVWIPFDLEKFDWTYPYGHGVSEDVIIKFGKCVKHKFRDYSYSMDISFVNYPYSGAYIKKRDCSSDLAIDSVADTNATFASSYSFSVERKPDGSRFQNELLDDEYFVFRTRTQTNETGRLVSAHYGVLYGGWLSGDKEMRFYDACFNPAPNDNVIDDGMLLRRVVKRYQSQMEGR